MISDPRIGFLKYLACQELLDYRLALDIVIKLQEIMTLHGAPSSYLAGRIELHVDWLKKMETEVCEGMLAYSNIKLPSS
jgi:hypothetical protein